MARNPDARGGSPRDWAATTIARASRCSLTDSTAPARRSGASGSASVVATPVTWGRPRVRVPVLSNRTASTLRIRSRASRSLTRMPLRATERGRDGDDQGDGQPQGVGAGDHQHRHGPLHRLVWLAEGQPDDQGERARPPGRTRTAARPPGRPGPGPRPGRLGPCSTSRRIPASVVSPHRVHPDPDRRVGGHGARHHPVAGLPWPPGRDSPVSIDSSSSADPSVITPSAGTRPPGRTSTRSPTARSPTATVSTRSPTTRSAWSGRERAASASRSPGGLAEGAHLQPVAEQHDHDEQGQLHQNSRSNRPRGRRRRWPRTRPGWPARSAASCPAASTAPRTGRPGRRPAAVQEHHRAQHQRHPSRPRELRQGEPQPLLHHLR